MIFSGIMSVHNSVHTLQFQTVFRHSLWGKKQNALVEMISIHPFIHPCISLSVTWCQWLNHLSDFYDIWYSSSLQKVFEEA
jgi:hypothetical protein